MHGNVIIDKNLMDEAKLLTLKLTALYHARHIDEVAGAPYYVSNVPAISFNLTPKAIYPEIAELAKKAGIELVSADQLKKANHYEYKPKELKYFENSEYLYISTNALTVGKLRNFGALIVAEITGVEPEIEPVLEKATAAADTPREQNPTMDEVGNPVSIRMAPIDKRVDEVKTSRLLRGLNSTPQRG